MDLLIKGSGHPMAGGFSIETNKLDIFKNELFKIYKKSKRNNNNHFYMNSYLETSAINIDLINKINLLEPYGSAIKNPLLLLKILKSVKL